MKKLIAILLIGTLTISLFGCGQNGAFTSKTTNLMDNIEKQEVDTLKVDETKMANIMTDFAVRLFQHSIEEGKNTLISPLSVISALAMTANGADGDTLAQMEEVFGLPIEEMNAYMYEYLQQLSAAGTEENANKGLLGGESDNQEGGTLKLANAIWLKDDESFAPKEDFLQTNANYYNADLFQEAFDQGTLHNINNWVAEKTDEMIPKIVDEISPESVMYLVNALAFEAEWDNIYLETQVHDSTFTKEDGEVEDIELMYSSEYTYLEDEDASGFIKYYKGGKYAFATLLPKEGMKVSDYVATLTGEKLHSILSNPVDTVVDVSIPKFETEYGTELKTALQTMGMTDAFDVNQANFSNVGESAYGNLYISSVLHKTKISVAEKGTKAGAATVVEVRCGAAFVEEIKTVILDRPFVYMLIDCETDTPFFIGSLMSTE